MIFFRVGVLLAMCAVLPAAAAPSCVDAAAMPAPPRALAMAAAAVKEHTAFGAQSLDAQGRLLSSGASEGEDAGGFPGRRQPWERVLGYWSAVNEDEAHLPSAVRFGALRPARRELLKQSLHQASSDYLQGLGVGPDQGLSSSDVRAVEAALDRVAVVDTPWSAAFISWLAMQAGLQPGEFAFSAAHAAYAAAAWDAGANEAAGRATSYAMRACDARLTPPRVGDLLCQTRGSASGIDSFDKLGAVLSQHRSLPMHCDVVVSVDATGFDAIGGNVLQSVTRRRMDFAAGGKLLDPSYFADGCTARVQGCIDRHMSHGAWSMLLQWR